VYQQAIATWAKAVGDDHPNLAYPLIEYGDDLVASNRPLHAISLLAPVTAPVALVCEAAGTYRALGPGHAAQLDGVERWLREYQR
jgi:hypothetical protein